METFGQLEVEPVCLPWCLYNEAKVEEELGSGQEGFNGTGGISQCNGGGSGVGENVFPGPIREGARSGKANEVCTALLVGIKGGRSPGGEEKHLGGNRNLRNGVGTPMRDGVLGTLQSGEDDMYKVGAVGVGSEEGVADPRRPGAGKSQEEWHSQCQWYWPHWSQGWGGGLDVSYKRPLWVAM